MNTVEQLREEAKKHGMWDSSLGKLLLTAANELSHATKAAQARDCRVIRGDRAVIVSESSAYEGYKAISELAKAGRYERLLADDASFVRAALDELKSAANAS